jgi:hypothetical protein
MRRTLIALVLVCGFCLPLATLSTVGAQDEAAGGVVFTVHSAFCSIDDVNNPDVGLYEACHENKLGGVTFTLDSLETEPVSLMSDDAGVAAVEILDGLSAISQVTLVGPSDGLGGYVYCADQIGGAVLFDGPLPDGGTVPLFTIDNSQLIICDWYSYTDGLPAPVAPAEATEVVHG